MMSASENIDDLISNLTGWRGKTFASIRRIIRDADPEMVEEWKWMGTPVWSHYGIVCLANALKGKVKLTFSEGASVPDPGRLFNNGLEGKRWRSIDFHEGVGIKERPLKILVRSAVAYNRAKVKATVSARGGSRK